MKEFKINDILTLKLENKAIYLDIKDTHIGICGTENYITINLPIKEMISIEKIDFLDGYLEKVRDPLTHIHIEKLRISPEDIFWGFCSNFQVWVESGYTSRLIETYAALRFLKILMENGDSQARKIFEEIIMERLEHGSTKMKSCLLETYLKIIDYENVKKIFFEYDSSIKLDLFGIINTSSRCEYIIGIIFNILKKEEIDLLFFEKRGEFRNWMLQLIENNNTFNYKVVGILSRLLNMGYKEPKKIFIEKLKKRDTYWLWNFGSENKTPQLFSHFSKEELLDLTFKNKNELRSWLTLDHLKIKYTNYKWKVEFPYLIYLCEIGIEEAKNIIIDRLESGNSSICNFISWKKKLTIFSGDELVDLFFSNQETKKYSILFLSNSNKEREASNLLHNLLKLNIREIKIEVMKMIENEHPLTLETISRENMNPHFTVDELCEFSFNNEKDFKPWLNNLLNNDDKKYKFGYPFLRHLAQNGFKKAKEYLFKIIKTEGEKFSKVFYKGYYNSLFTEEEIKELSGFLFKEEQLKKKKIREFKINDYITLKLEEKQTNIYIKGEEFKQCVQLLTNTLKNHGRIPNEVTTIDILAKNYKEISLTDQHSDDKLTPEEVFWGHCSNLQVWAENNYDINLLYSKISIPLLKQLKQNGDPIAIEVYKDELRKAFKIDKDIIFNRENYKTYSYEEINEIIQKDFIKEKDTGSWGVHFIHNPEIINLRNNSFFNLGGMEHIERFYNTRKLFLGFDKDYYEAFIENDGDMGDYDKEDLQIQDITGIGYFKKLEELNIHKSQISDINEISELYYLKKLRISHGKIQDISKLTSNVNLKHLNLAYNEIHDINYLTSLANLKELNFNCNRITHIDNIETLTKLKVLKLKKNSIFDIKSLGNLKKLEKLVLSRNQISEIQSISELTNLKFLNLSYNKIKEIESLMGLTQLKTLHLGSNKIEKIPKNIGNLVNLRKIYLFSNQISKLPETIGELRNLRELFITGNNLMEVPSSLGSLGNLEYLNLRNNKLLKIPNSIGNLKNLKELMLGGNPIEILPKSLMKLENLNYLDLERTDLKNTMENHEIITYLRINKVIINLPSQIKKPKIKIKMRGIEDIDRLEEENWEDIYKIGWDYIRNKNFTNSAKIGYYLTKLGMKISDVKVLCYGKDLIAISYSNSKELHVLLEAKRLFEEIISINDGYISEYYIYLDLLTPIYDLTHKD